MLQIYKNKFDKSIKNILIMIGILLVLVLVTLLLNKNGNKISNLESELDENGESNIKKLVINEIINNNSSVYADPEGNVYDIVELYNGSNKDIKLEKYSLSDDENKAKWFFGNVTIKPKSYMVIFLSGENRNGLYANFKLSKNGGETLVLKNGNGKIIDAVETVKTNKNCSMARDMEGNFKIVKEATPGFANTKEGYNLFINSLNNNENDIVINEVLVRNGGQFTDNYNDFSGYIELKNTTNKKINLKNYSLSNSENEPFKWHLPDINLNPNEIILIYTSGRDIDEDILHASFKLDSKKGNVILSKNDKIVQNVPYDNLPNGYALALVDGKYQKTGVLTGGFENNNDGQLEFAKKYQKNKNELIINEVMSSNYSYLPQNSYNFYDWVELKNNSDKDINLSDYYITTSLNNMEMYQLEDKVLKPGEYYILMASGDENLSNNSYKHANFKISSTESLYLIKDNKVTDSMFICDIKTGYSYGRNTSFGFIYMSEPTPGKNNNSGKYEIAYSPDFSINAGVYNDVNDLTLEIDAPGTIYYTLNGSYPTSSSYIYNEPIKIDKTTVVKAISVEDGKYDSNMITASYIINENHTLPVLSVSLNPNNFYSLETNAWDEDLEYGANAELFELDGTGFDIDCGLKLFGGSTRGMDKKSFSLKFRKKYGSSELHYQVFENRDNSVYNSLVLRSGSQDSIAAMMRDPLMTSLMDGTDVDVQAYKSVILYINGSYWGVYNIREKVDENFIASHYNVDPEKTNIVRIDGELTAGSKQGYLDIINYVNSHNMANDDNYNYIKEKIDIDSLITFWVAEVYTTNNDIINCRFFSHPDIDDGKWKLIFYDLDYGLYNYRVNYYSFMTDPAGMSDYNVPTDIMRNLMKNKEFKKRFVEILSKILKENLSNERILKYVDNIYNLLLPEMPRNQERWGQTMKDWNDAVDELKNFVNMRRSYLLTQTKNYFGLSNDEMKEYFGE